MAKTVASLTDKQIRFCHEYLKTFNATQAYKLVYSSRSTNGAAASSSELLRNPKIQAYLSTLRKAVTQSSVVTLERTLEEISRVAFSNIVNIVSFDSSGVVFKSSDELPAEITAAIESVTCHETESEQGVNRKQSIKMHNKITALGYLADFFGIRDDFNKARATLKRYGIALTEDNGSETGWKVEKYVPGNPNTEG